MSPNPNTPCLRVYSSSEKSCVPHWSTKLCIALGDRVVFCSITMQAGWDTGGTTGRWNHGQVLAALTERRRERTQHKIPRDSWHSGWPSAGVAVGCPHSVPPTGKRKEWVTAPPTAHLIVSEQEQIIVRRWTFCICSFAKGNDVFSLK